MTGSVLVERLGLVARHQGGPLILRLDGTGQSPQGTVEEQVLGPADAPGAALMRVVPGGTWQSALPTTEPALVSCVVSPGFDFADFRLSDD